MYRNLGWDQATCAKNLHITQRTLHNWETGRHDIPYTAYRLLRLLNRMELPGPSWAGWCFVAGVLYTPEGRPLLGTDGSWWSLLVRQAAMFRELTARGAEGRAEGAPLGGGASARAAAPGPDAHASGRREALAPLPLTAWPSSRQFQQPAQALNVSTPPPGNHGDKQTGSRSPCSQSDGKMLPLWRQPSDFPPNWNETPAPDANGSESVSMPWFALRWTLTCAVNVVQLQRAAVQPQARQQAPIRPPWQAQQLPPSQQPPRQLLQHPQHPSSPGSSAAPWLVGGDPGYGATPHVLVPSRSVPPAEGVAPPARPRHLLSPVPPAPAVSAPPRSDNGQPRGASYMCLDGYPRPGKTGFYYVDKSIETIISGWGR